MTPTASTEDFIIRAVALTFCGCLTVSLLSLVAFVIVRDGTSTATILQFLVEVVWSLIAGLAGVSGLRIIRTTSPASLSAQLGVAPATTPAPSTAPVSAPVAGE